MDIGDENNFIPFNVNFECVKLAQRRKGTNKDRSDERSQFYDDTGIKIVNSVP
ncbi:MAG: hypothetical protein HC903_01505 [Methylacidiphilales bacterium]|nr:hypothetical protein [Candidatus Methylacidiphilales bacterium]